MAGGALLALMGTASAQLAPEDLEGTWTFTFENDGFFGSDDNYTSGLRISYLSGNERFKKPGRFFARKVLSIGPNEEVRHRRGFAIAQELYTPTDQQTSEPLPDQHPYAAYLYTEFTSLIERPNRVDQASVQLGIIGPAAFGQQSQDFVHSITGREQAQGWDNQIGNTPGINFSYERQRRLFHGNMAQTGFGWDFVPNFGFSAGTVRTAARVGFNIRVGENLTSGYGPPRVRPSTAGSGFFTPQNRRSWYVFAGSNAEAVAHSVFLEGSLFRDDDPSVDMEHFVADLQGGLAVQLGPTQLAFTYVRRTEEFDGQDGKQQFGALSFSARF